MSQASLFDIIAPIVNNWNAHHEYARLAAVLDENMITISPVGQPADPHLPGPVIQDLSMLSVVYGFALGVHVSKSGAPFILI